MKIAALYARVSSAKQQLNENIASQVAAIEEYARQNDYQISPQHLYKDDGFSGARLDRHIVLPVVVEPSRPRGRLAEQGLAWQETFDFGRGGAATTEEVAGLSGRLRVVHRAFIGP